MLSFSDLYSWVKDLPIVDWHNHLDPAQIAADRPLGSLYEVWVKADPYKHRAMRICGEPEELITENGHSCPFGMGGGTDKSVRSPHEECERTGVFVPRVQDGERTHLSVQESDRWAAWMRTLPKLVGNPLFAWARMELEFLGLDPEPYLHGRGENVSLSPWTPSRLLRKFNVEMLCPCAGKDGERTLLSVHEQRGTDRSVRSPCEEVRTDKSVRSPSLREFPKAMSQPSSHFCPTLWGGDGHARNLPHVAHDGGLVFLTFRLADSLPELKLRQFSEEKDDWLKKHPKPWSEEVAAQYDREFGDRIDAWLDAGSGSCLLRQPECRQAVVDALEKFNETGDGNGRYVLHSYVIMPNHVHVLFELRDRTQLAAIIQGWKGVSARRINLLRNSSGKIWQEEYFDCLIRNAEHYGRTVDYIRKNAASLAESMSGAETENGHSCPFEKDGDDSSFMNAQECAFSVRVGERTGVSVLRPSLRMNAGDVVSAETLAAFQAARCRVVDISVDDTALLETHFESLRVVAEFAAAHGWTMLLHLGALRETSTRLRAAAGPAGGYAGMRAPVDPSEVARFLDRLEQSGERTLLSVHEQRGTDRSVRSPCEEVRTDKSVRSPSSLPRTILLTLNPEAHAQLAVLAGSFNGAGMPGKVQLGPAWWWCDHEEGIRDVLEKNAAYGVLSTFVGMTTDSRSLLSFVRHDYFRRILCRWVAEKVAAGSFPDDAALLRPLVENICYRNARQMVSVV